MNRKKYYKNKLLILFVWLLGASVYAQQTKVAGVVSDENGNPIPEVKITTIEGENKAMSGRNGQYTLDIDGQSDVLLFSLQGYQSQTVKLTFEEELNVTLQRAETYNLDETVYLGNSIQRRGSVTGSVSAVNGGMLEHVPVPNLSQALAGRLAGLYTYESYSEPSRATTTLRVRGATTIRANQPLIVIDGFPYAYNSNELFEFISAMEVESITVLKDASTQVLYGIQGADGVIVVTTRRGTQKKLSIDVKIDQTFEQTSTRIPFLSSDEFVPLRNQAGFNDGLGRYNFFSQADEEKFISGENRELYPNNNWRKMNMKDFTNMQRVGMNVSGGNGRAVFFTNLNVMHQDGMWKTDQPKYDPNNNFLWANFRSNVDVRLNRFLSAALNLSGNIKREKTPGNTTSTMDGFANNIYYRLYTLPPHVYGPVTPAEIDPATGEVLNEGGGVVVTATEPYTPYAAINRMGYRQYTTTNIYAQFALKLDLDFLTKGLDLAGYVGYQTNAVNTLLTGQTFASFIRTGSYDELQFAPYGTNVNTPLSLSSGTQFYYNLNFKGILDYDRSFGEHHVNGMAFAFYQNLNTADMASPYLLPYKGINSGISAGYDYGHRYLVKFDLGYSGSEQFAREHRFTALPSLSAGWVVSDESFMERLDWLSLMKLRASYGQTATSRSGLGRYVYLDNINLRVGGGTMGYFMYFVNEGQAANPFIEPEIATKQNYGIDLTLFNNLAVSADVFIEKMDNMVSGGVSSVPAYQGIPLGYYPRINSGIFENRGYELSVDYTKAVNDKLSFNVGGWLAYTHNKVIFNDESERAEDYAFRKREEGFSVGQQFGYIVDKRNGNGFFNSREEIENSNLRYEIGTPRPGDLKYYDLNNDGIINEKDMAPIGLGSIPRYTYAFHANAQWKNVDLSVLFQGVDDYFTTDMGAGRVEYPQEGMYSDWHKNAWTAERYANGDKITYPALSTVANSNHQINGFFLDDRSYLRLKNLTVGYTFPEKVSNLIAADRVRLYVSGQNLFTWHHLPTKAWGPEGSYLSIPVYRLYNIGLSVKF